MREVQIYLEDQRLDLFGNDTIEISQKIKDAKEISKVFTDYTRPFEIPASDANNKIFKHFYNFNISTGNFDARVRHSAKIFLNSLLFRKGNILLTGVKMRNKKPHTYSITFVGNTMSLIDTLKDDSLTALVDYTDQTKGLVNFDHDFSYSNVKTIFEGEGLQTFSDNSALIYPLITSKKRLFYNSTIGNTDSENFDGNIYAPSSGYDIDQYRKRGVKPSDLKPAIKVYHIIKAIEEKYNISFIPDDTTGTEDFFSKENPAFSNLYLWISNSSGNIDGEIGDDNYIYKAKVTGLTDIQLQVGFDWLSIEDDEIVLDNYYDGIGGSETYWNRLPLSPIRTPTKFLIETRPDSSYDDVNYRIRFVNSDTGIAQTMEGKGDTDFYLNILPQDGKQRFYIEIHSETPMQDTSIRFNARGAGDNLLDRYDFDILGTPLNAGIDATSAKVVISSHLPDIKIIDFLTGLMKMFNLVAYYIDDESDPEYDADTPVIKVVKYDDFYADAVNNQSGGTIDITKYVDVSEHRVNTSLPFSDVDFRFQDTDTVLNENHFQLAGHRFGNSNLPVAKLYPEFFFGDQYEVKVPFSHIKYERLLDTDIQWGYAAGGDFNGKDADYSDTNDIKPPKGDYNSISIKPLLFYGVRHTDISENINFSDDSNTTVSLVNDYYRPSNTNETAADAENEATYSINFDSEFDEWQRAENFNSLFEVFHKKYIESVFDPKKRLSIFTAYLPPSFLIHYRLNDQLKIQDEVYRINSIRVNLTTGKSELELINLNSDEIL